VGGVLQPNAELRVQGGLQDLLDDRMERVAADLLPVFLIAS
jgi:hypothetical protein